uniref:Uncharacterized protein n=1 Tax=Moniliophthora roreri TaxID=221103 RepID=A0A0W0FNC2_MONRR
MSPLIVLMVGIAPTLIILRSSLGLTESAVPDSQMISTLRFGEPPAAIETGPNSEVRSVDLQQGNANDESSDLEALKIKHSDVTTV